MTGIRMIDGYWIRPTDIALDLPDRIICTNSKTILKPTEGKQ